MHVYCSVYSVLLQGGANLNSQDFDGWTPLHAAAHWGQKEACEMLVEEFCDMDMKNYVVGNCQFINLKMFMCRINIATVNKVYAKALSCQPLTVWVWV
jgi:ankyrin repeat protein